MATTKIWPIKDDLKRVVDYAKNPDKTELSGLNKTLLYTNKEEKACFVTGLHCDTDNAFAQMLAVKNRFGKTGGNVAYHAYQSFKPGEVTAEKAHNIGVALAKKLWTDRFQVVVATHLDREHLHNHFVINSVSYVDGKKFNDNKAAYNSMRKASDELCRSYSLSVIKDPTGHTPRSIYFAEKRGEPTKYNLMRQAIDFAITCSKYPGDFEKVMLKQGYVVDANPKRKHATIRSVNDTKATRIHRLGEEYLPENIIARIRSNTIKACGKYNYFMNRKPNRPRKRRVHGSFSKAGKVTGLVALYYHYRYLLGLTPKKHRPISPEIREDLRRLNRYSEQVRLICKEHFKDDADVKSFADNRTEKIRELTNQRNGIYNKLRRCTDVDVITDLKSERDRLTDRLSKLRKEVRTANNIVADIPKMKENIRIERQMRKPPQRKRVRELER